MRNVRLEWEDTFHTRMKVAAFREGMTLAGAILMACEDWMEGERGTTVEEFRAGDPGFVAQPLGRAAEKVVDAVPGTERVEDAALVTEPVGAEAQRAANQRATDDHDRIAETIAGVQKKHRISKLVSAPRAEESVRACAECGETMVMAPPPRSGMICPYCNP